MKEITLNVKGLICTGCENRLQNAVNSIEGVEKVIADHSTNKVIVTLREDALVQVVKETIENLGFEIIKD